RPPQPRAEGHQLCQPDAAVRPRSDWSCSLAWSRRSGRPAVLQRAPSLGAASWIRVSAEQPAGRPRGIRRLQHGSAPGQHQYAWHQSSDRQRAGHQPDHESAGDDCLPVPARARPCQHDLQRHLGGGRSESQGWLLPELEHRGRLRVVPCSCRRGPLRRLKGGDLDTSLTNFNSPDPDPNAGGIPLQSRRPYPAYGRIRMWATDGESDYHSLQTEYKHRGPWGLYLSAAYTLSELNDNQQGGLNASRARRQNPRRLEGEYGPSADDQRHRLVLGYVWDIPFGDSLTGFTGALAKGWQISGIGIFNSGSPLFINQDGDTLNVDSEEIRPNLVAGQDPTLPGDQRTISRWFNTAAFARATTTYGTSPRNPVVGPGRKVLD